MLARYSRSMLAAGLMLIAGGCVPRAIAWFPDSSGFVYTAGENASDVVLFDMAKRARRVVARDSGCDTPRPAISPDGRSVALARGTHAKDELAVQFCVFDLSGRLTHRSTPFTFRVEMSKEEKPNSMTVELAWPREQLLYFTSKGAHGFYKLDQETVERLEDVYPLFCHGLASSPDGKGYLATAKGADDKPELRFVGWDGSSRAIPGWERLMESMTTDRPHTRWQGSKCFVSDRKSDAVIDVGACSIVVRPRSLAARVPKDVGESVTLSGGTTIAERPFPEDGPDKGKARVEAYSSAGAFLKTVIDRLDSGITFFPSPDGNALAIRQGPSNGEGQVYVVDRVGSIVASFGTRPEATPGAVAGEAGTGRVRIRNESGLLVKVTPLHWVDERGAKATTKQAWAIEPGEAVDLEADGRPVIASRFVYLATTSHGSRTSHADKAPGAEFLDCVITERSLAGAPSPPTAPMPVPPAMPPGAGSRVETVLETAGKVAETVEKINNARASMPSTDAKKSADIIVRSVTVSATQNGSPWDSSGPPDLKVYIEQAGFFGRSHTTGVKQDTTSATFNEKSIRVKEGDAIRIVVYDADVFDDDVIGTYEKTITADTLRERNVNWSFGDVYSLRLEFEP